MSDCFAQILNYLDPIIEKDLLGLRCLALKVFSSLIQYCRKPKVLDEEIKKTRKGLINISLDYVQGLIKLYVDDENKGVAPVIQTEENMQIDEEDMKEKFYRNESQGQILRALRNFCSISKSGKLSNLFL